MNWKPPSITTRTAGYLRKIGHLSDADKLEYFDNIVGAAFRKGYNVRKGDELKMRGKKGSEVRLGIFREGFEKAREFAERVQQLERSMNAPGSPSSALQITNLRGPSAFATVVHFRPVE